MPISVGDGVLRITGDTSGVDASLDRMRRKAGKAGTESAKKLGMVSQALQRIKILALAAVAAFAAFAVVKFFKDIVKASSEFQAAMNNVRALTGAVGKSFDALKKQAKELGRTTQFTARQVADGMGFLAQAGFEANEILGAMPATLKLAAAAGLDLASSADIVSNVMAGFGQTVEELPASVDVLTKAFTSANTDLQQLGQAMKFAGPIAKSAGVSFEETAAALALMGNAGIQASMAGTGLRKIITSLQKPTGEARKIIKRLGISVFDSTGKMRSLIDILKQFEKAPRKPGDEITIFGQRAGPAFQVLLGQGSLALDIFTQKLENSGGTADEIANIKMEGLRGAVLRLKSAFEGLQISIGETGVTGAMTGMTEALTEFLTNLTKLTEASKDTRQEFSFWAEVLRGFLKGVEIVIITLVDLWRGFVILVEVGVGELAHAFEGLFDLLAMLPGAIGEQFKKARVFMGDIAADARRVAEENMDAIAKSIGVTTERMKKAAKERESIARGEAAAAKIRAVKEAELKELAAKANAAGLQSIKGITDEEKAAAAAIEKTVQALVLQATWLDRTADEVLLLKLELAGAGKEQLELARHTLEWIRANKDAAKGSKEAAAELAAQEKAMDALAKQIEQNTLTPLERFKEEQKKLNELFKTGRIDLTTYNRALAQLQKELDESSKKTSELESASEDLAHVIGTAFEDAIIGGEGLRAVLKGLLDDINRIILRATVTKPLANLILGGLGKALPFIPFLQHGGFIPSKQAAIVGERGPELFVPKTAGTIIPAGKFGKEGDVIVQIDARGAAPGVELALARAMRAMESRAIRRAVNSVTESRLRGG